MAKKQKTCLVATQGLASASSGQALARPGWVYIAFAGGPTANVHIWTHATIVDDELAGFALPHRAGGYYGQGNPENVTRVPFGSAADAKCQGHDICRPGAGRFWRIHGKGTTGSPSCVSC